MVNLMNGDCLELMPTIPDTSIDLILCDLPYRTVNQSWDVIIPFEPLWEQYRRIVKPQGAIVLFANEPFATLLRHSNLSQYRYDWIWDKCHCSNFQMMNFQPGRQHELICVFSPSPAVYTSSNTSMVYYPQKEPRDKPTRNGGGLNTCKMLNSNNMQKIDRVYTDKHPTSIISCGTVSPQQRVHPTQKPTDLLEYLIKTYTKVNDNVLDNCMGSGSTGVACVNLDRNFIGIELDDNYFEVAKRRIEDAMQARDMKLW